KVKLPERKAAPEAKRAKPIVFEMESKFEIPRLLEGYNTVTSGHADSAALTVLETILSGGKTSRLYTKLIEGERLAAAVSASNSAGRYPGWFAFQVDILKDKDRKQVQKVLLAEIKRL